MQAFPLLHSVIMVSTFLLNMERNYYKEMKDLLEQAIGVACCLVYFV